MPFLPSNPREFSAIPEQCSLAALQENLEQLMLLFPGKSLGGGIDEVPLHLLLGENHIYDIYGWEWSKSWVLHLESISSLWGGDVEGN